MKWEIGIDMYPLYINGFLIVKDIHVCFRKCFLIKINKLENQKCPNIIN